MKKIVLAVLTLSVLACGAEQHWVKNTSVGNALGTTYSIIYLADSQLDFSKEIDSVFAAVNASMSTYIPNSDISKINAGDTTVVVDHMFKEVFLLSEKIHHQSNGYFDPTVGPLVNAWGFGPGQQMALDSARVDSLLEFVGFDKISLMPDGRIQKTVPAVYVDFNAVAKGYTIDRLGAMLTQKGIANYLIELGGEILVLGENKVSGKKWTVGIDDPQMGETRTLKKIVSLKEGALASSGNYRKYRVDPETGKKYVHTINPKTGFTKNANVLAASVLANNCATADAFATTFMAMDLADTKALLQQLPDLEAYIIYVDDQGETQEFMSDGFTQKTAN